MNARTPTRDVPRATYAARARIVAACLATVVVLIVAIVSHAGGGGPSAGQGTTAAAARAAPPPSPKLVLDTASRIVVAGNLPPLPWPATGQAAIGVQGVGTIATSQSQHSVPIASVTKIMTAYLVLRDHPLSGDAGGPVLRITEADALAFQHDAESGDSNLDVVAGELIDERQLLEGLLIPSADNIADLLATWDAGSIGAFVAKMNAAAAALGMTGTHYADASGLDPQTVSTARDQVLLAAAAMANPVFDSIVDNAHVVLPVSGEVWNYNPLIGVDGVVGVKSGFTSEASACLVAAAWRTVGHTRALLIAVALGQPNGLYGAGDADRALLDAVTPLLEVRRVVALGDQLAEAQVPWSEHAGPAVATQPADLVVWPGLSMTLSLLGRPGLTAWTKRHTPDDWVLPASTQVGDVVLTVDGSSVTTVPLDLTADLDGPPQGWTPPRGG